MKYEEKRGWCGSGRFGDFVIEGSSNITLGYHEMRVVQSELDNQN